MIPKRGSTLRKSTGIQVSEFYDAFYSQWIRARGIQKARATVDTRTHRIGIAVSGGVDSMALAWLCASLARSRPRENQGRFDFHAFIVNHSARKESTLEAIKTRKRLYHQIGIPSTIKSLSWPPGVSPIHLPDIETQARRLRYQTLGTACLEQHIEYLLLAHHSDDQAETVLMRLAAGHRGANLQGMPTISTIPECWGMHGIHQSGSYEAAAFRLGRLQQNRERQNTAHEQALEKSLASKRLFEDGGVRIMRPLMDFSKQQLVETCEANSIEWEEDQTNHDVSQTPRNTIRKLFGGAGLPQALEKRSLLGLADRARNKSRHWQWAAKQMLETCKVTLFDVRSGMLFARMPASFDGFGESNEERLSFARHATALFLQRLAGAVSPQEEVSLESLQFAAKTMYPSLASYEDTTERISGDTMSFTAGGVAFARIESVLPEPERKTRSQRLPLDPSFIWSLSRQPYSDLPESHEISPADSELVPAPQYFTMSETSAEISYSRTGWSPWRMWDGRFWIRVSNLNAQTLVIRPLREEDSTPMRASMSKDSWKAFQRILAEAAPGKVRFTLPVIAETTQTQNLGKVLALPTLGKAGWLDSSQEDGKRNVKWEVRYKHVAQPRRLTGEDSKVIVSWNG